MSRWSSLLAVLAGSRSLLFRPRERPAADILDSCGGAVFDGNETCTVEVSASCEAKCTPINIEFACSAKLEAGCSGGCTGSASAQCMAACSATCSGGSPPSCSAGCGGPRERAARARRDQPPRADGRRGAPPGDRARPRLRPRLRGGAAHDHRPYAPQGGDADARRVPDARRARPARARGRRAR